MKYQFYLLFVLLFSNNLFSQDISIKTSDAQLPNCDNGSVELDITGGFAPYDFYWTKDVGNGPEYYIDEEDIYQLSDNTTYCVTITDALCGEFSDCYMIDCCPELPNVLIEQFCNDINQGSITLEWENGQYYEVNWEGPNGFVGSGDITDLNIGTYNAVFDNGNGCTIYRSYNVGFDTTTPGCCPELPEETIVHYCEDENDGSITFSWSNNNRYYYIDWTGPNGFTGSGNIADLEPGTYTAVFYDDSNCTITQNYTIDQDQDNCCPDIPQEIITGYCNLLSKGSISFVSPHDWEGNISWSGPNSFNQQSDDITDLEPGIYIATFSGPNGCMITEEYEVGNSDDEFIINADWGNPTCGGAPDDGYIDLQFGDGNYSVEWYRSVDNQSTFISSDEDLSNLYQGYYYAIIDNGICTTVKFFYLTCCMTGSDDPKSDPLAIAYEPIEVLYFRVYGSNDNQACDGRVSFATNLDGNYLLTSRLVSMPDNTVIPYNTSTLCPGDYCLTVDSGCDQVTECFTISDCSDSDIAIEDIRSICELENERLGQAIPIIIGGEPPYSYLWSNGSEANVLEATAGNYTLTVSDVHGCSAISSVNIESTDIDISATISEENIADCNEPMQIMAEVTIGSGNEPYIFQWNILGSAPVINNSNTMPLPTNGSGNWNRFRPIPYWVTVTDACGFTTSFSRGYFCSDLDCDDDCIEVYVTKSGSSGWGSNSPEDVDCYDFCDDTADLACSKLIVKSNCDDGNIREVYWPRAGKWSVFEGDERTSDDDNDYEQEIDGTWVLGDYTFLIENKTTGCLYGLSHNLPNENACGLKGLWDWFSQSGDYGPVRGGSKLCDVDSPEDWNISYPNACHEKWICKDDDSIIKEYTEYTNCWLAGYPQGTWREYTYCDLDCSPVHGQSSIIGIDQSSGSPNIPECDDNCIYYALQECDEPVDYFIVEGEEPYLIADDSESQRYAYAVGVNRKGKEYYNDNLEKLIDFEMIESSRIVYTIHDDYEELDFLYIEGDSLFIEIFKSNSIIQSFNADNLLRDSTIQVLYQDSRSNIYDLVSYNSTGNYISNRNISFNGQELMDTKINDQGEVLALMKNTENFSLEYINDESTIVHSIDNGLIPTKIISMSESSVKVLANGIGNQEIEGQIYDFGDKYNPVILEYDLEEGFMSLINEEKEEFHMIATVAKEFRDTIYYAGYTYDEEIDTEAILVQDYTSIDYCTLTSFYGGDDSNSYEFRVDNSSSFKGNLKVYPNPFSSLINFEVILTDDSNIRLELFDISSKLILSQDYYGLKGTYENSIDLERFDSNIGMLKITTDSDTYMNKIIKEF